MVCLGHQCPIYDVFDPAREDCCLTVHRSCYSLLVDRLEHADGAAGTLFLLQRIAPYINSQGVVTATGTLPGRPATPAIAPMVLRKPRPWLGCDPTDLPPISPPMGAACFSGRGIGRRPVPPPLLVGQAGTCSRDISGDATAHAWPEEDMCVPRQLLTPPTTPTGEGTRTFAGPIEEDPRRGQPPPKHSLLTLPPHMLLAIVSHLCRRDITVLSQTCSALQRYLSSNSSVWGRVCRMALRYTPRHLTNSQMAEYYLQVRGNNRLEGRVLVQRGRVERVIHHIVQSPPLPPPLPSPG
ncbi:hypothetical protein H4R19_006295 [Coemansia spiralis]|nr:hypothetical protein H4R19_006295 [Coemansia spiralis]